MLHKLDGLLSRPIFRLGAWALLCVLTLVIFLYPAHLTDQAYPVESMYVFSNLLLFGTLFSIWFVVLLGLALSHGNEKTRNLENMVLVAIFTLVFEGIWVSLRGSYAVEASRDASNIDYLSLYGHISQTINTYRGDFPGAAIVGSAISQITGIADWNVLTLLLMLQILLFPALLYLVFKNVLKDSRWAVFGVLLAIAGSIMVDKQLFQFHPASFGIFFLFTPFVLLLTREQGRVFGTLPGVLLLIIFIAALTTTHFATSCFLFLVLIGVYVLQRFTRKTLVTIAVICLCFMIVLVWEMFHANLNFSGMLALFPTMLNDFRQGLFISGYTASLATSYTSAATPLWANLTRYFWLALLFGFAAVLGIRNLIRVKKLNETEIILTGGLIATGMLLVITLLASGATEIERVLLYAPFFTVPLLVLFITKLHEPLRKYSFVALAVVLAVLIFPTFLAHNNTVDTTAYYSYEFTAYSWLKQQSNGELYYAGGTHPIDYYFEKPEAQNVGTSLEYISEPSVTGLLAERLSCVDTLEKMSHWYDSVYNFESGKETAQFEHLLGFGYNLVNSPEWQEFLQGLNQQDRIYDNGYMQLYKFGSG